MVVETELGKLLLSVTPMDPPDNPAESQGYTLCVKECHSVLDAVGIPSAKGIECKEPGCNSALGHRLRELVKKFREAENLLQMIRNNPQDAGEILGRQNHSH